MITVWKVCANGADIFFSTADPLEGAFNFFCGLTTSLWLLNPNIQKKKTFYHTKRHFIYICLFPHSTGYMVSIYTQDNCVQNVTFQQHA